MFSACKNEENDMAYFVLKDIMLIVPRCIVCPLTKFEARNEYIKAEQVHFMDRCRNWYGELLMVDPDVKIETVDDNNDDRGSKILPYKDD